MNLKTFLAPVVGALLLAACASDETPAPQTAAQPSDSAAMGSFVEHIEQRCQSADRVFFETDRSDLSPQARSTIECWANWLKENSSAQVTIEGHADERGTREYNLALGDRRANSAASYLQALGVNNQVQTISYGKERPVDPGHSEAAWSKNRRAVITVSGGPTS